MELDNKLATRSPGGTVTSLYRRLGTEFHDHSSLTIGEDDTRINFVAFSVSVDRPGSTPSDVVCESV